MSPTAKPCPFPGCGRPSRRIPGTLCGGHDTQRRRGQELRTIRQRATAPLIERDAVLGRVCEIPGCESLARKGRGRFCAAHIERIRKWGDPDFVILPADRNWPRGAANHSWNPEPKYGTIHARLRAKFGPAAEHLCPCGSPAGQWAYIGPREPGQRRPFGDLDQYQAMCKSCHKRMDLEIIRRVEAAS